MICQLKWSSILVTVLVVIHSGKAHWPSPYFSTTFALIVSSAQRSSSDVWIPKHVEDEPSQSEEPRNDEIKSEYTDVASAFVRPGTKIVKPSDFVSEKPAKKRPQVLEVLKVYNQLYSKADESESSESEENADYYESPPPYEGGSSVPPDDLEPHVGYEEGDPAIYDDGPPPTYLDYQDDLSESEEDESGSLSSLDEFPVTYKESVLKAIVREMGYDDSVLVSPSDKYDDSTEEEKKYSLDDLKKFKLKKIKKESSDSSSSEEQQLYDLVDRAPNPALRPSSQKGDSGDDEMTSDEYLIDDLTHLPAYVAQRYTQDQLHADGGGKGKQKGKGKSKGKGKGKRKRRRRPHRRPPPPPHYYGHKKHKSKKYNGVLETWTKGSTWERVLDFYHQWNDGKYDFEIVKDWKGIKGVKGGVQNLFKGSVWEKMLKSYGNFKRNQYLGYNKEIFNGDSVGSGWSIHTTGKGGGKGAGPKGPGHGHGYGHGHGGYGHYALGHGYGGGKKRRRNKGGGHHGHHHHHHHHEE